MDRGGWTRFASLLVDLAPDRYAAELGLQRLRRYGVLLVLDGVAYPMADDVVRQPEDSNPLYIDRDREFEPLTDAFAEDPLLARLLNCWDGWPMRSTT